MQDNLVFTFEKNAEEAKKNWNNSVLKAWHANLTNKRKSVSLIEFMICRDFFCMKVAHVLFTFLWFVLFFIFFIK